MTIAAKAGASTLASVQGWIEALPPWRRWVVAVAGGAFGALAFAPFYVWPALALTLSLAVWLVDGAALRGDWKARAWSGFARGFFLGYGHFLAGTYWVGSAFTQVPGAEPLAFLGVLGMPLILAPFWGLACGLAALIWTSDLRRIAALAATFFFAEMLRSHLFGGLPWNLAGYVWEAGGAVSQIAAAIGVFGLTAITLPIMMAPATLADLKLGWGARAAPSLAAALVLGLLFGAGAQRLNVAGPPNPHRAGPVVRVVDPGYTQREKWEEGKEWNVAERYLRLSGTSENSNAAIVVWPEAAIPTRYPDMPPLADNPALIGEIGRALGSRVLIAGSIRVDPGPPTKFYNTAYVVTAVGGTATIGQSRDKNRLTPFGEFIPLYDWFKWLPIKTLQEIGDYHFSPGDQPARMIVPGADSVQVLICYESIFPNLIPRGSERPSWLANISIDAWYGEGTGPFQNDNQSRYRTIEEGLPMARAASGGVSGIVDAYGRRVVYVERKAALESKGAAVEAALPPTLPETLYAKISGGIIPVFLAFFFALRYVPPSLFGRRSP